MQNSGIEVYQDFSSNTEGIEGYIKPVCVCVCVCVNRGVHRAHRCVCVCLNRGIHRAHRCVCVCVCVNRGIHRAHSYCLDFWVSHGSWMGRIES